MVARHEASHRLVSTLATLIPPLLPMQVMQDMLMDVLRALASPNLDIRQKTLDLTLDLVTARNIDEVGQRPCRVGGLGWRI